jgi:hypothetical protein
LLDKKSRIVLSAQELNEKDCSFFPGFADELICRDDSCFSVLSSCVGNKKDSVNFNQQIVVARRAFADCAAHFEQEFYLDTVQRCLVWRLYEGDGGCHSMNERTFVFAVPKPPEGYAIRFEEYALPPKR